MIKKISILVLLSIFIISCWENEEDNGATISWLIKTETQHISIDIPSNWKVMKDFENILPKPKDSSIELAVTSENSVNGFSNNLLILSDDLTSFISSKDFSILNNIWAETDYLDYKKIESKTFKFLDEEESMIYIFEAKYNLDTPKLKFLQTAHICNQNKAFFFTIAIPKSVSDTSKYEYLLSTFSCK